MSRSRLHILRQDTSKRYSVYFVDAPAVNAIKIGITDQLDRRLSTLRGGSPTPLALLLHVRATALAESRLHKAFSDEHLHGEWFAGSHRLRQFISDLALLDEAKVAAAIRNIRMPSPQMRLAVVA